MYIRNYILRNLILLLRDLKYIQDYTEGFIISFLPLICILLKPLIFKNKNVWFGPVAQLIECLPGLYRALGLIP